MNDKLKIIKIKSLLFDNYKNYKETKFFFLNISTSLIQFSY